MKEQPQRAWRRVGLTLGLATGMVVGGGWLWWAIEGGWGKRISTGMPTSEVTGAPAIDPVVVRSVALFPGRKRDEIPTVDRPVFAAAPPNSAALTDDDWILGVAWEGVARAYPLWILSKREIVNDRFGDEPVCVTYCPLSASAAVYLSRVRGDRTAFGNEGGLYECNLVLYDRRTGSLWYQMRGEAIHGPLMGERLVQIPGYAQRWGTWRRKHPGTSVLVGDERSGQFFRVATGGSPLSEIAATMPEAPVSRTNALLPAMERVVGVRHEGREVWYTETQLRELAEGPHAVPGLADLMLWVDDDGATWAFRHGEAEVPWIGGYWFAWHAAFPAAVRIEGRGQRTGSTR